ncbi:MAG TPA: HigA family addiction module antitoxin [Rhizomicrobium sp.]|jgi:addiction module HigA family antidote|nr:HigA family addiction module antitoxin [Rhizomicrobium sp.]
MPRNPLLKGLPPMHPGEHLREDILPALGKSKAEIARLLGVSRQTLYDVLNEKQPITANLALRIGKLVGGGAEIWLRLQQAYDLEIAERALAKTLKSIPTLHAAE